MLMNEDVWLRQMGSNERGEAVQIVCAALFHSYMALSGVYVCEC